MQAAASARLESQSVPQGTMVVTRGGVAGRCGPASSRPRTLGASAWTGARRVAAPSGEEQTASGACRPASAGGTAAGSRSACSGDGASRPISAQLPGVQNAGARRLTSSGASASCRGEAPGSSSASLEANGSRTPPVGAAKALGRRPASVEERQRRIAKNIRRLLGEAAESQTPQPACDTEAAADEGALPAAQEAEVSEARKPSSPDNEPAVQTRKHVPVQCSGRHGWGHNQLEGRAMCLERQEHSWRMMRKIRAFDKRWTNTSENWKQGDGEDATPQSSCRTDCPQYAGEDAKGWVERRDEATDSGATSAGEVASDGRAVSFSVEVADMDELQLKAAAESKLLHRLATQFHLQPMDVEGVLAEFKRDDLDGSGTISHEEFLRLVARCCNAPEVASIGTRGEVLWSQVVREGSDTIDVEDFLRLYVALQGIVESLPPGDRPSLAQVTRYRADPHLTALGNAMYKSCRRSFNQKQGSLEECGRSSKGHKKHPETEDANAGS